MLTVEQASVLQLLVLQLVLQFVLQLFTDDTPFVETVPQLVEQFDVEQLDVEQLDVAQPVLQLSANPVPFTPIERRNKTDNFLILFIE